MKFAKLKVSRFIKKTCIKVLNFEYSLNIEKNISIFKNKRK